MERAKYTQLKFNRERIIDLADRSSTYDQNKHNINVGKVLRNAVIPDLEKAQDYVPTDYETQQKMDFFYLPYQRTSFIDGMKLQDIDQNEQGAVDLSKKAKSNWTKIQKFVGEPSNYGTQKENTIVNLRKN